MGIKNKTHKLNKDFCRKKSRCKGNKGILRVNMPQIKNIYKFIEYIQQYYTNKNIFTYTTYNLNKNYILIPTQKEINEDKALKIMEKMLKQKFSKKNPIVISKDNYILDGHHRWAALKLLKKKNIIFDLPVIKFYIKIKKLLKYANTWNDVTYQQF